jgi:DNA polymerase III epsilon subunit-like protein
MNKLFAVDVETTGLDPAQNSIVAIGAVDIETPERTFYIECKAWEGSVIEDGALKVNGFTREQIEAQEKTEAWAIQNFFSWLTQDGDTPIMVAHNAGFDKSFVAHAAKRADVKNPFSFRTIDIHSIVYMHLLRNGKEIPTRLSLNECLESFGLDREPDPHNALTGAKCNQVLFKKVQHHGNV